MGNLGKQQSVLFVDNERHWGGGQIICLNLINALRKNNFKIGLLLPPGSNLELEVKDFGLAEGIYHIERLDLTPKKNYFTDLLRLFKHGVYNILEMARAFLKYDLVYINSTRLLPISLLLLYFMRKDFVIHLHLLHENSIFRLVALAARSSKCKAVVCCSELVRSAAKKYIIDDRLITVRNSLKSQLSGMKFKNRFDKPLKIGFIGDISFLKGADIILKLAVEFPQLKFCLIGRNNLNIDLTTPNVQLESNSLDIKSLVDLNEINIVIVPSRVSESFGLVAIEACAMSCIAVVSSAGYLKEIGKQCKLSVCEDEDAYYKVLAGLCRLSSGELENIAKNSWVRVQDHYSITTFESEIHDLLLPLIRS